MSVCVPAFWFCEQIPDKAQIKGGRVYFGFGTQGGWSGPWLSWRKLEWPLAVMEEAGVALGCHGGIMREADCSHLCELESRGMVLLLSCPAHPLLFSTRTQSHEMTCTY